MFRRVEFIHYDPPDKHNDFTGTWSKHGLMGVWYESDSKLIDTWFEKLRGPYRGSARYIPQRARFYFTEKGWKEIGHEVIAVAQQLKLEYRVIAIKETDADIVWRDKIRGYEVAVQPRKKK